MKLGLSNVFKLKARRDFAQFEIVCEAEDVGLQVSYRLPKIKRKSITTIFFFLFLKKAL